MARVPRIVVVGFPHHIIQRGSRSQTVFFTDRDRTAYISFLKSSCRKYGVKIWAWCLMSNHVHFIAVPEKQNSLSKSFGYAHARYAKQINAQNMWKGHLWQERFRSSPLDEPYLLAAVRYVENNPVRAMIVDQARQYKWSSAAYHVMKSRRDPLVSHDECLRAMVGDWKTYLEEEVAADVTDFIRQESAACRPIGGPAFIKRLEKEFNVDLSKKKPGRKAINW